MHPDDSSGHADGDLGNTQHASTHYRTLLERNGWPNRHIYPSPEAARTKAKEKDETPRLLLKVESYLMLDQSVHNTAVSQ